MVEDWEYLYRVLRPVLPATATAEMAQKAHAAVFSSSLVRVGAELAESQSNDAGNRSRAHPSLHYPDHTAVDNIALRREIRRLHQNEAVQMDAQSRIAILETELTNAREQLESGLSRIAAHKDAQSRTD